MACCRWLDFTHISLIVSRSDIPILLGKEFFFNAMLYDYLLWKIRHLVISIRWIFHINAGFQDFDMAGAKVLDSLARARFQFAKTTL